MYYCLFALHLLLPHWKIITWLAGSIRNSNSWSEWLLWGSQQNISLDILLLRMVNVIQHNSVYQSIVNFCKPFCTRTEISSHVTLHSMFSVWLAENYVPGQPEVMWGDPIDDCTRVYRPPVDEFEVVVTEVQPGQSHTIRGHIGPSLWLVQQGSGEASCNSGHGHLPEV